MTLGENISKYRKKFGLTQAQLAEMLEVSQPAVGKYETNDRLPSIEKLITLSDAFDHDFIRDYLNDIEASVQEQTKSHSKTLQDAKNKYSKTLQDAKNTYMKARSLLDRAYEMQDFRKFVIPGSIEEMGYSWEYDYDFNKWIITNNKGITKRIDNSKVVGLFDHYLKHLKIDLDDLMALEEEGDNNGNPGEEETK